MATVTAPTAYLEGITRPQLFKKLVPTGFLQVGTITSALVSSITDTTRLLSTQYDSKEWIGGWVRIASTPGNVAPVGEICPISDYMPELGTITVSPVFSIVPPAGTTYELWKIDPSIVKDLTDDVLTDVLQIPTWSVLSEVPDFDMEATGVVDWTGVGATPVKASTTPVQFGQYLRVTSTVANGYTRTANLGVEPGKACYYGAAVRSGPGATGKVILWDETNNAEISSQTTVRKYPVRVGVYANIPATCYEISIRLAVVESGLYADYDGVIYFSQNGEDIAAPSWVKNGGQVKGVFKLDYLSVANNLYDITLRGEHNASYDVLPGRPFRIKSRYGPIAQPLFIFGTKNETAYASDIELKYLDNALLVACMRYKLIDYLNSPIVSGILDTEKAKAKLLMYRADYMLLAQQQADELNKILRSPTPSGGFLDERYRYGR